MEFLRAYGLVANAYCVAIHGAAAVMTLFHRQMQRKAGITQDNPLLYANKSTKLRAIC